AAGHVGGAYAGGWHQSLRTLAVRVRRVAFRGWSAEALEFYEGLEADNTRTYWNERKDAYQATVLGPLQELLAELEPTYGEWKIFRPYRDTRFSKDKSPYKTQLAARLGPFGYIQLGADGLGVGSGLFHLAPDQLTRFRGAIVTDRLGADLEHLLTECSARAETELISHDALKTAPRGYPKDHPRIALLRMKGLAVWRAFPVKPWLGTAKAKSHVVSVLEAARPVNSWLAANVGESELPDRGR
ncbi:MAG: hypothetical protein JWM05_1615, partial [Acidimicrobiales bacterium]|nr:hypothetical protein [Acidimicrobiales bacterium]